MDRKRAIETINDLYGAPGQGYETSTGEELLAAIIEEMGLDALTDEAVIRLASKHRGLEERGRRLSSRDVRYGRQS